MEIQGRIIVALPERSGVSARGEWKSQDFVIETHEAYPKKMVFSVFGADRLAQFNIQEGQEMSVSFDIDAHEYNGRWFNNIRAYDAHLINATTAAPAGPAPATGTTTQTANPVNAQPAAPFPPANPEGGDSADDLPF
jgi:hypothetical protein